ncbi:MAG: DUF4434 domain-containing protein [Cellvibrionales bacterium]|nr:DUF4434 domain-containing protein [Cellvibrionales bacterium]
MNWNSAQKITTSILGMLALLSSVAGAAQPVPVAIVKTAAGYELTRGGSPYIVKGAGMESADVASDNMERLVAAGGNSLRTWSVGTHTDQLLERAEQLGLTVALCLNIAKERHGFDYSDKQAVAAQLQAAEEAVRKYRDHPALLAWIIGNELNYDYKNPQVYDAVNEISKMIHRLDPHHPTTTTIAGISPELVATIQERAPDLDFLSVQLYGDLLNLPRYIEEIGYSGPYFITEWGSIGHWEVGKTRWRAPIEPSSSKKAAHYLKSFRTAIASHRDQVIGNYVFLWGQKQERTPTWYGLFTENGESTEAIDTMQYIWTGSWPNNRSPQLKSLRLDRKKAEDSIRLQAGKQYRAKARVKDPERDPLQYRWSIKRESDSRQHGGDFEQGIADIPGLIQGSGARIRLQAPPQPGTYRLFLYALDGRGNAAHGNIPFQVLAAMESKP